MARIIKALLLVLLISPVVATVWINPEFKNSFSVSAGDAYIIDANPLTNPEEEEIFPPEAPAILYDAPCPTSPCVPLIPTSDSPDGSCQAGPPVCNSANGCAGGQAVCNGTLGNSWGYFVQDPSDPASYWWTPELGGGGDGGEGGGGGGGQGPTPSPRPPGPPPIPIYGNLQAHALTATNIEDFDTCAKLQALKDCVDSGCTTISGAGAPSGIEIYVYGYSWGTQVDAAGVLWSDAPADTTYAVTSQDPTGTLGSYIVCHNSTSAPTFTYGNFSYLSEGDTNTYLVGMSRALPWFGVKGGGNTYGNYVLSLMPLSMVPTLKYDTTVGYPGIISSGSGFDLAESPGSVGYGNISEKNWNTNNAMTAKNWYTFFKQRLSQGTVMPYSGLGGKPTPSAPYTVYTTKDYGTGDLIINETWDVQAGEKIIVLVEGSLNINNPITITGNGFIAFVVSGNITIDGSVGTTWNSEIPVVEGVYISGGTLKTGTSAAAATERFVGKGIFIANEILTQRNLVTPNANKTNSADLFLYNPAFLVTVPAVMQDLSYEWQEVVP